MKLFITAFGNKVFALDRTTGQIRWRVMLGGKYELATVVEIAIDDDTVIVCTPNRLGIIDYASGELRKEILRGDATKSAPRPTMVIDGKQIFIAGVGVLSCYTTQGELVWDQPFKGEGYGAISMGLPGNVRQADDTD